MSKIAKSLVTIVLLGASVYYIVGLVGTQYERIGDLAVHYTAGVVAVALLCHLAGSIINAAVWHRLLLAHGGGASFPQSFRAWAVSRLLRYLPGKVFGYVGRIYYQPANRKTDVVAASVSDLVVSYLPILLLVFLSLLVYWQHLAAFAGYFVAAAVLVAVLFFAWPLVLKQFWNLARKFDVEKPQGGAVPDKAIIVSNGSLALLAMLIHGLSLYILLDAVQAIGPRWYFFVVSAFYVSAVIGQLAVFVPAGLGVREATLAYFLSLIGIDPMVALVAAVVSRLIIVATELLNVLLAQALESART